MIGFLPVDPLTYQASRECRRKAEEAEKAKLKEEAIAEDNSSNEQTKDV